MTQQQLDSLTEDELAVLFYVVNVVSPMTFPQMEFDLNSIKWFRHDMLIRKLLDSFNRLKPEGHATYTSLLEKLGVKIEIKKHESPPPTSTETSTEKPVPTPEVVAPVVETPQTGSTEIPPSGSV